MQLVLLAAAVVNQLVTGDTGTTVVLAGLTVFNAVIGLRQEAKAEESVKALAQMMKTIARVRRDGQAIEIDAEELVPGDVVLVEAGNRVPADGRVLVAATLEIEEAALTGESLPVGQGDRAGRQATTSPLGDRTCMAYMNTSVTRGRGEMVVTATGMEHRDRPHRRHAGRTPRPTRRRCRSSSTGCRRSSPAIAGVALVLVVLLGLARASRSTRCSSPASRWPSPRSRPGCPRWSRHCCRSAPARSPAATRSSSGCRRWRRSARPRRSARTRPAR